MVDTRRPKRKSEVVSTADHKIIKFKNIVYHKRNKMHQQQETDHLVTPPPISTDSSSSEEDTKSLLELLQLEPVSGLHSHNKIPHETRMRAAAVLKDSFVSQLEVNGHQMEISDMISKAKDCFSGLRMLDVYYQPFCAEILKLINSYQKLKHVKDGKYTGADLDLKVAYEGSVLHAHDAKEKLHTAKDKFINTRTNLEKTRQEIRILRGKLRILQQKEALKKYELQTLRAKRNQCSEAYICAQKNVKETRAKLEGIEPAIKEEVWTSLGWLRDLWK